MSTSVASWVITLSTIERQSSPYTYSILLVFGVIGCSLNILLLSSRHKFRSVTCCVCKSSFINSFKLLDFNFIKIDMLAASIIMLIHMCVGIGTILYSLNSITLSPTYSKIRMYLSESTAMMYRWCLVAASFDRYALSSPNLHIMRLSHMKIARHTVITIIIAWIVLPVHNLIYNTSILNKMDFNYNIPLLYYQCIFTLITGCILPVSIMIVCSLFTYHNLVIKRKHRQAIIAPHGGVNNEAMEHERKQDHHVLLLLIIQIVVFASTIIPFMCNYFYNAITLNIKNKSIERLVIENFVTYLTTLGLFLFPASSFYLYTMTSSMFRHELISLIRIILRRDFLHHNTRIEPSMNAIQLKSIIKH